MDKLNVRRVKESDFLEVHKFVLGCKPLELYPKHLYKIIFRYFGNTCYILKSDGKIIGFIMGFVSQRHKDTYFLWQIGIEPFSQGQSIGSKMLSELEKEIKNLSLKRIETTVDPQNIASKNLFKKNGYKNISKREGKVVKIKDSFAVKDYYSPGRNFILYEKRI